MLCQCRLGRWLSLYSLNMNITKRQLKAAKYSLAVGLVTCILSNCLQLHLLRDQLHLEQYLTRLFSWICLLFPMIRSKRQMLNVMKSCANGNILTREQKFEVFCRVCDNMLAEGRLSKANHSRWTNIW